MLERTEIKFNAACKRQHEALGREASWRDPIHHVWVLVNGEGHPVAQVKTLGVSFPEKDRRYAARIEGVQWWSPVNVFKKPMWSTLRGFKTLDEAREAVEAAREFIFNTEADEV